MKLEFSQQIFEKNAQIPNFMKILPLEAELFHAERQTDMTKLKADVRNVVNAPKDDAWQYNNKNSHHRKEKKANSWAEQTTGCGRNSEAFQNFIYVVTR